MKYMYQALTEIKLGGKVFLPGTKLPEGIDYQSLYDNGMAARSKVVDESKEVNTVATPIEIKVKRHGKKRKNKGNR